MATVARPLDRARLTEFSSGKTLTVTPGFPAALHFLSCAVASACWVVPRSAATFWPQRSASEEMFGPPWALTKKDVPAVA